MKKFCKANSSMIAVCVYAFKDQVALKRCCWALPYYTTTVQGFLDLDNEELKNLIKNPPAKSDPDPYIAHDLCFEGKCTIEDSPKIIDFVCDFECNLKCVHCISDFGNARNIKVESPRNKILEKLFSLDYEFEEITMDANGETFFHYNKLVEFLKTLNSKKLKKVNFITNATLLSKERLKELKEISNMTGVQYLFRVSIDGCTKETYEAVRIGANFEQVINNTHLIIDTFGKDWVKIYFCCKKQNIHEFNKMNDFTIKEFGLSTGFLSDAFDKEMQKYCANSVFF